MDKKLGRDGTGRDFGHMFPFESTEEGKEREGKEGFVPCWTNDER